MTVSDKLKGIILPVDTRIDAYSIRAYLDSGGFGLIYLAEHTANATLHIIKEYMPKKYAYRDEDYNVLPIDGEHRPLFFHGRKRFLKEAQTLVSLHHKNIVQVENFFHAHNTIYLVMPYITGKNLTGYLERNRKRLKEREIRRLFIPLLHGLKAMHEKQILHLDIKPDNIFVDSSLNPLLLDFGSVHTPTETQEGSTNHVITTNFSPIEQYDKDSTLGPWSDIYALCATIRTCMDKQLPPSSQDRSQQDTLKSAVQQYRFRYSSKLRHAIDWGMSVSPEDRPQQVDELLSLLTEQPFSMVESLKKWLSRR